MSPTPKRTPAAAVVLVVVVVVVVDTISPYSFRMESCPQQASLLPDYSSTTYHILTRRLSGAAASLKHAQPHDLPSFPSVGIETQHSGNQAASIAHANQKPFEHWKPAGLSSSASKAALYAHKDGGKLDLWQPKDTPAGHSAAGAALYKQHDLPPQPDHGYTDDGRKKALRAATLSTSTRGRSGSSPAPPRRYPDAENASANALNAATVAHRPAPRPATNDSEKPTNAPHTTPDAALDAARLRALGVGRSISVKTPSRVSNFSSTNDEEKNRKAALRASTISMSRQRQEAAEREEAAAAPSTDIRAAAKDYLHLQEAAHRLASERLDRLDPDGVLAYRAHYGYKHQAQRNRLSIRGGRGRRGSDDTEGGAASDDEVTAGRIRSQMNKFNDQIASVDAKKRQRDRSSLMAAAEKAVHERMSTMDRKMFEETGKITPGMMEEWEAKAREKAAADSKARLETHGMVNVGGGKFMTQTDVDAIAAGRMQPTLDEISGNAEKQRARDEEIRLDQEERKRHTTVEKAREKDTKAEVKAQKQQEKDARKEEKEAEKIRKKDLKEHREAVERMEKAERKEQGKQSSEINEPRNRLSKESKESTATTTTASTSEEATGTAGKPSEGDGHQGFTSAEKVATKESKEGTSTSPSPYTLNPSRLPISLTSPQQIQPASQHPSTTVLPST